MFGFREISCVTVGLYEPALNLDLDQIFKEAMPESAWILAVGRCMPKTRTAIALQADRIF